MSSSFVERTPSFQALASYSASFPLHLAASGSFAFSSSESSERRAAFSERVSVTLAFMASRSKFAFVIVVKRFTVTR